LLSNESESLKIKAGCGAVCFYVSKSFFSSGPGEGIASINAEGFASMNINISDHFSFGGFCSIILFYY